MRELVFLVLAAIISHAGYCEMAEKSKRDILIERNGGYIARPNPKPGKILIVNSQTRVPSQVMESVVSILNNAIHTKIEVRQREGVTLTNVRDALKDMNAVGGVVIVDNKECENVSLVSPEDRWAIVNVSALSHNARNEKFVETRTSKEIIRTFAVLFGAFDSSYKDGLFSPIMEVRDLDKMINDKPPMDVMGRVRKYLEVLDVETRPPVTYAVACKEGWAPQPTNEFQKTIWDKIHAMPTAPIKIKPETKPTKE